MKLNICWATETHQGNHRQDNQDSLFADGKLFVVADGLGGHKGGAEASQLAVQTLQQGLAQKAEIGQAELSASIAAANHQIYQTAQQNFETLGGMGTTVCALYLNESNIINGNVGDSRLYQFNQFLKLTQLTQDHNDEFNQHLLTRAVGTQPEVEVDTWSLDLSQNQSAPMRYLLCTDGLTNEVPDEKLEEVFSAHPPPAQQNELDQIARTLLELALTAGGRDNITLILLDLDLI